MRFAAVIPPEDPRERARLAAVRVRVGRYGRWVVPLEAVEVEAGRQEVPDLVFRHRLARCAGCDYRTAAWHCQILRERVWPCSSCLRLAAGEGDCPAGYWAGCSGSADRLQ